MSTPEFHVVEFLDEQATAVVPHLWLTDSESCVWPPYKSSVRINGAVQREEVPGESWSAHSVRILFSGSLENARRKLSRSEETSDLQSDSGPPSKRPKNMPRRLVSEESDASSEGSEEEELNRVPRKNGTERQNQPQQTNTPASEQMQNNSQVDTPRRGNVVRPNESTRQTGPLPSPPPRISVPLPSGSNLLPSPPSRNAVASTSGVGNLRMNRVEEVRDARMFRMLEELQEQMREQTRLLQILVGRSAHLQEQPPSQLPEGVSFPLKTLDDMDKFEDCILNSQSATSVVRYLAEYGGNDVKDTVGRILKAVVTTDLARSYNFKGAKGKLKFENLNLVNIIFRCVRLNPVTRACTRNILEGAIKKWLSGARDRDGGRKDRMRMTPANEDAN